MRAFSNCRCNSVEIGWNKRIKFFCLKLYLHFVEFTELFCYQYFKGILQVVIRTAVLKFVAQVSIFILAQVSVVKRED